MKTAEELAALRQEVKDFKETFGDDLKAIKAQTKATNGSIARTIKNLEMVRQKQDDCPARVYHTQPTKFQEQRLTTKRILVFIAVITIIINLVQFVVAHYLFKE